MFHRQQGFTLIEILIALSLMTIGVLSFSLTTVGVIQGHVSSRNFTAAIHLAQTRLEQIQALALESPVCPSSKLPVCSDSDGTLNFLGTTEPPGLIFQRAWVITPDSPEPGLTKIDVTVSWTERLLNRRYKLSTLVFGP